MVIKAEIMRNTYRDSIALMRIARELFQRGDVPRAEVLVATPANIDALRHVRLFVAGLETATPNDIIVAVEAESDSAAAEALASAVEMLTSGRVISEASVARKVFSLQAALQELSGANLALLSIPGSFVRREAVRALERNLNLFIFSDNVPLENEIELKRLAESRGLLVMGPDCGTAIINGIALGFANKVRQGCIGLIGASGTGLQEVSCLIDRAGHGVSHAIGTGTNDVKNEVGAISLLRGLRMLESDPASRVISIVTKPLERRVQKTVLAQVAKCRKPVIVNFLGGDTAAVRVAGAIPTSTLEEAARRAVEAAGGEFSQDIDDSDRVAAEYRRVSESQKYVRGVFSGGTFASEAALILTDQIDAVSTNTDLNQAKRLTIAERSVAHTCVDLGEDEFTQGKPHPMIEPRMRHQRIAQEASDPETAVLLLDVVLGFGAHPDPAGGLVNLLRSVRETAAAEGRYLPVVTSVCGTEGDPQIRSEQVARLHEAGALVLRSNAAATLAAASIAKRELIQNG